MILTEKGKATMSNVAANALCVKEVNDEIMPTTYVDY